ncbi:hypothetical protein ACGFYY_01480 [Streptomyces sp. NPDC048331]|uniref:hypothetical protein n=1 Tax=Streptomyces sp. NPDC048331 TaxID=3365534 RepID=UPI00371FE88F
MTGGPEVEEAHAHPGGECARAHVLRAGCGLPAPITIEYGGPMADCRSCRYGWSVHHDPTSCWQPTRTEEGLIARIREAAPLLVSARAMLDAVVGRL